jgi:hypothetical protein
VIDSNNRFVFGFITPRIADSIDGKKCECKNYYLALIEERHKIWENVSVAVGNS